MPISISINGKYFLDIRGCKLRPQWVTTIHPTTMAKVIKTGNTNLAKDVEQPVLAYYLWECKWYNCFWKRSAISYKTKHTPRNATTG